MVSAKDIIFIFFESPIFQYDTEEFQECKVKAYSNIIHLTDAETLFELFDRFPNQDRVIIDFKMDEEDPITVCSNDTMSKLKEWLNEIDEHISIKDEDSIFYLEVTITKSISDEGEINVYCLDKVINYINSLDFQGVLSNFKKILNNKDRIYFNLLNSDDEFCTNTFYFSKKGSKSECYEITRDILLEKSIKVRYFLNASDFDFFPEDFYLIKRSKNEKMNRIFDKITLIYILINIADISEFEGNNIIKIRINGYRIVNQLIDYQDLAIDNLKSFYSIYQWIYDGGNLVDKIGLARNVITLLANENNILNLSDNAYETIKSNYIIYQKQNLEQYINIKNQVLSLIHEMSQKTNLVIESLADSFKKNIQWLVTFYITVFVFNALAAGKNNNIFTKDITNISYGVLLISLIMLIASIIEANMKKNRYLNQYDEIKEYYSDLLDRNDIDKTFNDDNSRDNNISYIRRKMLIFGIAWLLVLIIMFLITYRLSVISSPQIQVKSILVCNFLGNTFASPRFRASHFLNSIISKRLCRESRVDR